MTDARISGVRVLALDENLVAGLKDYVADQQERAERLAQLENDVAALRDEMANERARMRATVRETLVRRGYAVLADEGEPAIIVCSPSETWATEEIVESAVSVDEDEPGFYDRLMQRIHARTQPQTPRPESEQDVGG